MAGIKWTKEEEEYLKVNVSIQSVAQLSAVLKKSEPSINSKITRLGLRNIMVRSRIYTIDTFNDKISETYPYLKLLTFSGVRDKADVQDIRCGHSWETTPDWITSRGIGVLCPTCNNTNRKKDTAGFFKELVVKQPSNSIESTGEYLGAKIPISIKYKCGHEDVGTPSDMLNKGAKTICRTCVPQVYKVKATDPFATELQELYPELILLEQYSRDDDYLNVTSTCGHIWKINPHNLLGKGTGSRCLICYPPIVREGAGASFVEKEVCTFIKDSYSGWIVENDRSILEGSELDIVLPDLGLAIEFNGDYWHSETFKDKQFHLQKTNGVENFGYQLVRIFEHEWVKKKKLVQSILLAKMGIFTNRIYARQCTLKQIPFPRDFLEENHIQGAGVGTPFNYGLYFNDILVSVLTFGPSRFLNTHKYELYRFCTIQGTQVVGGFSKMLKHFVIGKGPDIMTYCDRRFSTGSTYANNGFTFVKYTDPGYFYIKGRVKLSRYQCQKHLLKDRFPEIFSEDKTGDQIMKEAGYHKVHDCGNIVYSYTKK